MKASSKRNRIVNRFLVPSNLTLWKITFHNIVWSTSQVVQFGYLIQLIFICDYQLSVTFTQLSAFFSNCLFSSMWFFNWICWWFIAVDGDGRDVTPLQGAFSPIIVSVLLGGRVSSSMVSSGSFCFRVLTISLSTLT